MKQHVKDRRERLRKLGAIDQAHRCVFCRRGLPAGFLAVLGADGGEARYCDGECHQSHVERAQFQTRAVS